MPLQLLGKVPLCILYLNRHHERVCHAQDTGFHTHGQGHSQMSKVKLLNYVPMSIYASKAYLNVTEK